MTVNAPHSAAAEAGRASPPRGPVRRSDDTVSPRAAGGLDLQRSVGNHATGQLVQRLRASAGPGPVRDADEVLRLQGSVGNRAVAQALDAVGAGSQDLPITSADGQAEAQAEAVADGADTAITPVSEGGGVRAPSGVGATRQPSSQQGRPLPAAARANLETRLGHDLGSVRVHTDARAHAAADALGANALTVGTHIFLGRDTEPESAAGRRLLAHEATHVVQQGGAPTHIQLDRKEESDRKVFLEEGFTGQGDRRGSPSDRGVQGLGGRRKVVLERQELGR